VAAQLCGIGLAFSVGAVGVDAPSWSGLVQSLSSIAVGAGEIVEIFFLCGRVVS